MWINTQIVFGIIVVYHTHTRTCPAVDTVFLFSRQVQLERIRQANSLERIRVILNDTNFTDISQLPET